MKRLLLILPLLLLSCKSTKNADCDAYGTNKIIRNCEEYTDCIICVDSIYCQPIHVHFYDHYTCEWSCLYMPEESTTLIDTFYFEENQFHTEAKQ